MYTVTRQEAKRKETRMQATMKEIFRSSTNEVAFDGGKVYRGICYAPAVCGDEFAGINSNAKFLFDKLTETLTAKGQSIEAATDNACSAARKYTVNRMKERGYYLTWE